MTDSLLIAVLEHETHKIIWYFAEETEYAFWSENKI